MVEEVEEVQGEVVQLVDALKVSGSAVSSMPAPSSMLSQSSRGGFGRMLIS